MPSPAEKLDTFFDVHSPSGVSDIPSAADIVKYTVEHSVCQGVSTTILDDGQGPYTIDTVEPSSFQEGRFLNLKDTNMTLKFRHNLIGETLFLITQPGKSDPDLGVLASSSRPIMDYFIGNWDNEGEAQVTEDSVNIAFMTKQGDGTFSGFRLKDNVTMTADFGNRVGYCKEVWSTAHIDLGNQVVRLCGRDEKIIEGRALTSNAWTHLVRCDQEDQSLWLLNGAHRIEGEDKWRGKLIHLTPVG